MRRLLNASNLRTGGGVQVAASVVGEILALPLPPTDLSIVVSSEVRANLGPLNDDEPLRVKTLDVRGLDPFHGAVRRAFNDYDRVFTLFGPLYRWRPPFTSIVGFAQPWIIYPHNELYGRMPVLKRLRTRLKYWVQAQFFKRSDILVVELEHVKEGLVRKLGIDPARIHVVYNCVSALYRDKSLWKHVTMPDCNGSIRLGFLGRNYLHKNTAVFPEILGELHQRHGIKAKFYVTFREDEWQACSQAFRSACINVGPLTTAQCPNFYRGLDAVVFASLLECFSATPLEAMAMEKPLFASDRPFNRDICGNHAWYFDPLSPGDAADKIARMFMNGGPEASALAAAREHAFSFSTPATRAAEYLSILDTHYDN